MSWRRQHASALLQYGSGMLFAFISPLIPLLPVILSRPRDIILDGALAVQLMLAAGAALWAVLCWRKSVWAAGFERLYKKSGVLTAHELSFDTHMITSLELERGPVGAMLGSVRLNIRTRAVCRRADISLTLPRDRAARMAGGLIPLKGGGKKYRAGMRSVAIMAASGSNAASGILLIIPVILKLRRIIDSALPSRLLGELGDAALAVLPGLPPALAAISAVIAAGWLINFIRVCLSYAGHTAARFDSALLIDRGAVVRRSLCVPLRAVSAVTTRQTLLMRLLGRSSCWMVVQGMGSEECCLVPSAPGRKMRLELASVFPRQSQSPIIVKPDSAGRRKYYTAWAVTCAAGIILWARLSLEKGGVPPAVGTLAAAAAALMLWRILAGALASRRAAVKLYGDCVEITGLRGLTVCTSRMFRGKIAQAGIVQSPISRAQGLCTVYIRARGSKKTLSCKGLPIDRAKNIIERLR